MFENVVECVDWLIAVKADKKAQKAKQDKEDQLRLVSGYIHSQGRGQKFCLE